MGKSVLLIQILLLLLLQLIQAPYTRVGMPKRQSQSDGSLYKKPSKTIAVPYRKDASKTFMSADGVVMAAYQYSSNRLKCNFDGTTGWCVFASNSQSMPWAWLKLFSYQVLTVQIKDYRADDPQHGPALVELIAHSLYGAHWNLNSVALMTDGLSNVHPLFAIDSQKRFTVANVLLKAATFPLEYQNVIGCSAEELTIKQGLADQECVVDANNLDDEMLNRLAAYESGHRVQRSRTS